MKAFSNSLQIICFMALIVTWLSCKKDNGVPSPVPFNYLFSANIDGTKFEYPSISYSALDSIIAIGASTLDSNNFTGLSFPNTISPGTYNFSNNSINAYFGSGINSNDDYSPAQGSGTLVITYHNFTSHVIKGTFSYTALPNPGNTNTNSHDITNGSFSIKYLE